MHLSAKFYFINKEKIHVIYNKWKTLNSVDFNLSYIFSATFSWSFGVLLWEIVSLGKFVLNWYTPYRFHKKSTNSSLTKTFLIRKQLNICCKVLTLRLLPTMLSKHFTENCAISTTTHFFKKSNGLDCPETKPCCSLNRNDILLEYVI